MRKVALSFLTAPLRALQARSGAAIGDAYARAAAVVLAQQERMQDEAAERSYQRRAHKAAASGTAVATPLPASSSALTPAE